MRASDWSAPLLVLIEEPRRTFKRQQGFMHYRDVGWPQVKGTIEKWNQFYNVDFEFLGSRKRAQRRAVAALKAQLRSSLVGE